MIRKIGHLVLIKAQQTDSQKAVYAKARELCVDTEQVGTTGRRRIGCFFQ
jgi:hypothetical protein